MNILLNLYPVQLGGGQQVARNFLHVINQKAGYGHNWFIFVSEGSELHHVCKEFFSELSVLSIPYSYKNRITYNKEVNSFVRRKNIDIIYNFCPILPVKGVPQVVWSVYSNLYFPEIKFWSGYKGLTLIKKKVIDHFRLKRTLAADGITVENDAIAKRLESLYQYPKAKICCILPSVSSFEEQDTNEKYDFLNEIAKFKILCLSSFYLNKNIHILAYVAALLKKRHLIVTFILSLDKETANVKEQLYNQIEEQGVESYFQFVGKVEARYVHQVVGLCNSMILLSKLESFSNNVIEFFYFKKPLLISDEEWAKAACKDSALYVKRDNAKDIADKIETLMKDEALKADLVEKGSLRLKDFNTPESKVRKEVEFLEYIYQNYEKGN